MVEEHSPQFNEVGELQKVDFLEGDVHLGFYDIRFNLDDNKFFNITNDGVVKVRVHTEPGIEKLWILFEDPNFRPIELSKYAKTETNNITKGQGALTNTFFKPNTIPNKKLFITSKIIPYFSLNSLNQSLIQSINGRSSHFGQSFSQTLKFNNSFIFSGLYLDSP